MADGSGSGGTPKDLNVEPRVGQIIMRDGAVLWSSEAGSDTGSAIAVVYKVENGKAWAVGKTRGKKAWCTDTADAYTVQIPKLRTSAGGSSTSPSISGYEDGSTGWSELKGTSGINDTGTKANYPAWYYCMEYGTTNCGITPYTTGWYFPSMKELYNINGVKNNVNTALRAIGGDEFDGIYCGSSFDSTGNMKGFNFANSNGGIKSDDMKNENFVCAVRVFTY